MSFIGEELENNDIVVAILRSQVKILRVVRQSASEDGLTIHQFSVLRLLSNRGVLPMSALSDELRVTPPVITGIIDRLEKKGLVNRTGSTGDRRKKEILLTQSGKNLYRKIQESYRWALHESLARSLTPAEQSTLAKLLKKFAREIPIN